MKLVNSGTSINLDYRDQEDKMNKKKPTSKKSSSRDLKSEMKQSMLRKLTTLSMSNMNNRIKMRKNLDDWY